MDGTYRVEQRESVLEQRKMIEELFNTPYFYFSHTLDLTNCQQKLDGLIENDAKGYFVLGTATPAFTWNYFMLRSGMQCTHCYFSRSNLRKMGPLQFCLLALLRIHRHSAPNAKRIFEIL